ncbi:POU domain class 2-associating factor 1 [Salarias fasciatus]|uniref:POU domain class 2-associating factor 1 n=1 Tax=Salarias fasciatus TaxID=181472 RepID=UPI0011769C2C|nr:POU domain class 2-associating factor 1 [Salarias fasciatus]
MHWEKSSPSAPGRSRPYQGVRVRDPVKELLRKKRSLELQNRKPTPPDADVVSHNNQSSFSPGIFGSDAAGEPPAEVLVAGGDGGHQGGGGAWKAALPCVSGAGLPPAMMPWSSSDYSQQQQDPPAQTAAHPAGPALAADLYMQTLCPSYTMLTYTHTPLLTNFGTIPVAPGQTSLPPMELQDSGLTYLPWAQSLTTISTMPNPGVQFAPGAAALPGSSLVHMPLSMSLTTMIPQLEPPCVGPHPQIQDLPHSDHHLEPGAHGQSLHDDPEVRPESPNLLDKILEDRKESGEDDDKDSYSSSIFIPDV